MDKQVAAARLFALAGVLVLVALLGSWLADWLWLALLPAAVLLAVGVAEAGHWRLRGLLAVRVAGLVLASASVALAGLAIVGLLLQYSLRMEPGWLTAAVTWMGWLFLIGAASYGLAAAATRFLPSLPSLLLALSLPLGFGLDQAMARIPGFFLHGTGFYLGGGLFASSLVWLGLSPKNPRVRASPGGDG